MPGPFSQRVGARAGRNASRYVFQLEAADGLNDDGQIQARTGQLITLTRGGAAGTATALDANGIFRPVGIQEPRLTFDYDPTTGIYTPGYLFEGARINSALGSNLWSDSAYWARHASFTIATAVSCIAGQTAYKHTANSQWRYQTVGTFVNGQTDCVSFVVENVDGAATTIGIRDDTAVAWLVAFNYSHSAKTMTLLAGSGAAGSIAIGGGRYILWCTGKGTAAGTGAAGNSRGAYIYPTNDGVTSSAIIHHGQFEANAFFPSFPIITGAGAATRLVEIASTAFLLPPQPMTIYVKAARYDLQALPGPSTLYHTAVHIGITTSGNPFFWFFSDTVSSVEPCRLQHNPGSGAVTSTPSATTIIQAGTVVEQRGTFANDGKVRAAYSIAGAAEVIGAITAAATPGTTWGADPHLYIGGIGTAGASHAHFSVRSIRIALGEQTLAYMRVG